MAKDWEEFLDEDECCLNCGEMNYIPSRTPGICVECVAELTSHPEPEPDLNYVQL
jgi:hypothetical protein